jgi:ABC-type antimicrobial peptide transport system permease subunit
VIAGIDPDLGSSELRPLQAAVARATAAPRFAAAVVGGFAGFALLLAGLGIHGVVSYAVTRRVPEIGLRRALGATAGDVVRLVAGQGAATLLCGVAVGLVAAVATAGVLEGLLFGVSARDAVAALLATGALVAAAVAATLLPARRALAVDPMRALRDDGV